MLINEKSIWGIVVFIILFSFSEKIKAQQQEIDTSEYLPDLYAGSLSYNLMIAASRGYSSEIIRLVEKGAEINAETIDGATPLIFAVANNKIDAVKTILSFNPELNNRTTDYETPLLLAVKARYFEVSEALIRAGADLNLADYYKATPLHYASLYGYPEIVDMLLYYNALTDERSEEGTTPLLASVRMGFAEVADILVQNGANLEIADNEGYTPFTMAAYYGDTLIMDLLYKKGADIYTLTNSNHNALTLAISGNHTDAVSYLMRHTNKWTKTGYESLDPYGVAAKYGRKEMAELLKKYNVPGDIKYEIDQISASVSSRFGGNDYFTGFSLSFKEPYLNAGFIMGCDLKLWYTKVLVKSSEQTYYQYLNKGSIGYAGVFKDFALTDFPEKLNYSISASLLAGYSFGNKLKGTAIHGDENFLLIPSVALKMTKLRFSMNLGLEYQKSQFYNNGPIWVRIGCSYNYYFDDVRTKVKRIKWLQ